MNHLKLPRRGSVTAASENRACLTERLQSLGYPLPTSPNAQTPDPPPPSQCLHITVMWPEWLAVYSSGKATETFRPIRQRADNHGFLSPGLWRFFKVKKQKQKTRHPHKLLLRLYLAFGTCLGLWGLLNVTPPFWRRREGTSANFSSVIKVRQ